MALDFGILQSLGDTIKNGGGAIGINACGFHCSIDAIRRHLENAARLSSSASRPFAARSIRFAPVPGSLR